MGRRGLQNVAARGNMDIVFVSSGIKIPLNSRVASSCCGGVFASVGQAGMGFGIPSNPQNPKDKGTKFLHGSSPMMYLSMPESGSRFCGLPELVTDDALKVGGEELVKKKKKKKMDILELKIKIGNPSMRRLISGAIAGVVSRTVVAPLETMRTHLMIGSLGHSTNEVFQNIMETDGWKGLFRGNLVNVIRVAPSKAIEVCN